MMAKRSILILIGALILFRSAMAGPGPGFLESDRHRKFELALKTLGIPLEKDQDFTAFPVAGSVSTSDVLSIAKYFDPDAGLRRSLSITPNRIDLFPGFYSPTAPNDATEFTLATGAAANRDSEDLLSRLDRVSRNVSGN